MFPVLKLTTILFLSIKLVFSISYGRQNALAMFLALLQQYIHLLVNHTHLQQIMTLQRSEKDDF